MNGSTNKVLQAIKSKLVNNKAELSVRDLAEELKLDRNRVYGLLGQLVELKIIVIEMENNKQYVKLIDGSF